MVFLDLGPELLNPAFDVPLRSGAIDNGGIVVAEQEVRLYLVNPDNPIVSLNKVRWNGLTKYRVWKPLGLLVVAGLTPPEWEVTLIDENLDHPDYSSLPRPDLVGVTAFTSQAPRAYEVAGMYRAMGVPVVMGGIHATFCRDEALRHADAVVTGEADSVWKRVLEDAGNHALRRVYEGGVGSMAKIPPARHDLLQGRYYCGSLQTTRGCPLNCSFCSVTAFNGGTFRHRPVDDVIRELRLIREKVILFVDDNLIGTRRDHLEYSKDLFRAMIREGLTRPWICQATINFADDEELLDLASRSGCQGVFIGFESSTVEGLMALNKKFNIQKGRDFRESVRRIQHHGICAVGSFIMGIDTDGRGIGETIAGAATEYGIDAANVLILTPLPGTKLYAQMEREGRIRANDYPKDWKYYTLTYPVADYSNLTWAELVEEVNHFNDRFYSYTRILRRLLRFARNTRSPRKLLVFLVANLSYRSNHLLDRQTMPARFIFSRIHKMAPAEAELKTTA
ncbi:MAG: B12-binding domain-containing radical SAM protein [Bryobacteraceae bacterium]|nr:B12-binding domain-containing radical SAM protein [Bryobacteraceae bacterium]